MARLWSYFRVVLDMLGGATLLSLVMFYASLRLAPENARMMMATPVSPVAVKIAAKVAPALEDVARHYRPTFVAHAGGPVARCAASLAYPVVVREIPHGTEIGCDRLLSHFGSLSLADLAGMLVDHARSKGESVHPSLRWYVDAQRYPGHPR